MHLLTPKDLHEPIDVYCEWIDATEKLQRQAEANSYGNQAQEQNEEYYDVEDDVNADETERWVDRKRKMEEEEAEAQKQAQAGEASSGAAEQSKTEHQGGAAPVSTAEEDTKNKEFFDDLFGDSDSD